MSLTLDMLIVIALMFAGFYISEKRDERRRRNMKKKMPAYPRIKLTDKALKDLPDHMAKQFKIEPLYKQSEPNVRGMVFIGTSQTGSGGISTFVHKDEIIMV